MTTPTQPTPTASAIAIARAGGDLIALNAAALRLFKGQYRDSGDRHSDALFVREGLVLLQERLATLDDARVRAEEECARLNNNQKAFAGSMTIDRERHRRLAELSYANDRLRLKTTDAEAKTRDVDRRLETAIAVLKWYGLEIVPGAEEGVTILMTDEDAKGVRDGAFVKPIPGGQYAADQSELKLLREELDLNAALRARLLAVESERDEARELPAINGNVPLSGIMVQLGTPQLDDDTYGTPRILIESTEDKIRVTRDNLIGEEVVVIAAKQYRALTAIDAVRQP